MSAERFDQLSAVLHPFLDLWQSGELACIAVGDETGEGKPGDFISLATRVVLKPRPAAEVEPGFLELSGIQSPFFATSKEYPTNTATQKIYAIIARGRFTLDRGLSLYNVRATGELGGLNKGEPTNSDWTEVRFIQREGAKAYGSDKPCFVLQDTVDAHRPIARLIKESTLREIDSRLRLLKPNPIDGVRGLVSSLMPGMRFSMDTSPAVQIVAQLPFDLRFDPELGLKVHAPKAAFDHRIGLSAFFEPQGAALSWELGTENSVESNEIGFREWGQQVNWPPAADGARVVLIYQGQQVDQIALSRPVEGAPHVLSQEPDASAQPQDGAEPVSDRTLSAYADAFVATPSPGGRPSLRMLADTALEDDSEDRLGFKAYAGALAGLIDGPDTRTPLTIAVNAPWGAGKTTLGLMIRRRLERKPAAGGRSPHITCWFDAWKHDDAPNLAASLAAERTKTANRSRPLWRRLLRPLASTLVPAGARRARSALAYFDIFLLLLVAYEWIFPRVGFAFLSVIEFDPKALSDLQSAAGVANGHFFAILAVSALLVFKYLAGVLPVAKSVLEFIKDPQGAAQTASMNDVSNQLGQLIRQATPAGSKFVVFIDDLERCRPPRPVDVLEVVNQLLNQERVVVVVLGDMSAIAACAAIKYKDYLTKHDKQSLSPGDFLGGGTYGREYLQKIIQLQFDLPMYSPSVIQGLMEQWTKGAALQRESVQAWYWRLWRRVVNAARPFWRGPRRLDHDRRIVNEAIETKVASGEKDFAAVEEAVLDMLKPSLSSESLEDLVREGLQHRLNDDSEIMREAQAVAMGYVEPFPRHAKRLLNRLRLLLFIAHERRMFGGEPALMPRHLGKWAVLCERWPELALALSVRPDMMDELEGNFVGGKGSVREKFQSVVKNLAPAYINDSVLESFCLSDVKLKPVIEQILHFEPAPALPPTETKEIKNDRLRRD